MKTRLQSLVLVALLTGCATGKDLLTQGKLDLASAPLCCSTLSQARRVALPQTDTQVILDKTAQAFDFEGTKSFFALYDLPEFEKPYSIRLTSMPYGSMNDTALLIPRVTLYDSQWRPTRFFDDKTLRNRGNGLERTIFINPSNTEERYIAIYGSDISASIERAYSMVTVTPVFVGAGMFNVYGGTDGTSTLHSSPIGALHLEVVGLSSSDVK